MNRERDIRLYMFLRLMLLYSVLLSLVLYQRSGVLGTESISKTYFVTFFTFLVTTGFVFLYEKAKSVRYFLVSQVAYDILFTTVLIFYTGPFESMYTVFYLLNITFSAFILPRIGAIMAAIASALLYSGIAWLNAEDGSADKSFTMLTTVTGFVSIALLATQLIEELRRSRQRISRLEELSEEIVNSLDSGLLALDSVGNIQRINRTASQLLGLDRETSVLGRPAITTFPFLSLEGSSAIKEVVIRGNPRRILITKVALVERNSMILLRDLTEVLDLEEKVRRQERLASVGRLATGVAHEIRNPIASISGAAQLLDSSSEDAEERSRLAALIVRESERVDRLVSQLLRFARPSAAQKEEVFVDEVVRECIEALKTRPDFAESSVVIETEIAGHLATRAIRDELSEAINNLLVNAMQALSDGDAQRPKTISVSCKRIGAEIEVTVADNGPGIPREYRSRVFDPFFSTKSNGTGLGLAQVHKIVREHNGQVDIETEVGKGTALRIRLPA